MGVAGPAALPASFAHFHLFPFLHPTPMQVFHGMVYADLLTNPLIVPVKILRGGHTVTASEGVADCAFHPTQPWIFTAGADSKILLYCN